MIVDQIEKVETPIVTTQKLEAGEIVYVQRLEERNRYLTMLLGEQMFEIEQTKELLKAHRKTLAEAYNFVLAAHGLPSGNVDTAAGTITTVTNP